MQDVNNLVTGVARIFQWEFCSEGEAWPQGPKLDEYTREIIDGFCHAFAVRMRDSTLNDLEPPQRTISPHFFRL